MLKLAAITLFLLAGLALRTCATDVLFLDSKLHFETPNGANQHKYEFTMASSGDINIRIFSNQRNVHYEVNVYGETPKTLVQSTVSDDKVINMKFQPAADKYFVVVNGEGSFQIQMCPKECLEICPNECSGQGLCDVTSGKCHCMDSYARECSINVTAPIPSPPVKPPPTPTKPVDPFPNPFPIPFPEGSESGPNDPSPADSSVSGSWSSESSGDESSTNVPGSSGAISIGTGYSTGIGMDTAGTGIFYSSDSSIESDSSAPGPSFFFFTSLVVSFVIVFSILIGCFKFCMVVRSRRCKNKSYTKLSSVKSMPVKDEPVVKSEVEYQVQPEVAPQPIMLPFPVQPSPYHFYPYPMMAQQHFPNMNMMQLGSPYPAFTQGIPPPYYFGIGQTGQAPLPAPMQAPIPPTLTPMRLTPAYALPVVAPKDA